MASIIHIKVISHGMLYHVTSFFSKKKWLPQYKPKCDKRSSNSFLQSSFTQDFIVFAYLLRNSAGFVLINQDELILPRWPLTKRSSFPSWPFAIYQQKTFRLDALQARWKVKKFGDTRSNVGDKISPPPGWNRVN